MHLADGLQAPAEQVENAARPLAELQQTLLARQVALYEEKRGRCAVQQWAAAAVVGVAERVRGAREIYETKGSVLIVS